MRVRGARGVFRSVHTFVCPVRQGLCPGRACQGALAVMEGWEEVVDPVGTGSHPWDREWGAVGGGGDKCGGGGR